MLDLLGFFFEGEGGTDGGATSGLNLPSWAIYVILGVLLVGMVLMMILPQRKQKKRAQEMMAKLAVGSIVTTIGGIIGEVVQYDDKHIWLATGLDGEDKHVVKMLRQAIHSIDSAADVATADPATVDPTTNPDGEEEVDEIK